MKLLIVSEVNDLKSFRPETMKVMLGDTILPAHCITIEDADMETINTDTLGKLTRKAFDYLAEKQHG